MNAENESDVHVKDAIESFWKVIPPLWHYMRSNIHRMAGEEFGMTTAQYHVMHKINEGKSSVSELSSHMFVSRPNISRAVEDLVNGGWVERERDPQDRRNVYLFLTEKGLDLINQMKIKKNHFMQQMFSSLSTEELHTITSAFTSLEKILVGKENK